MARFHHSKLLIMLNPHYLYSDTKRPVVGINTNEDVNERRIPRT